MSPNISKRLREKLWVIGEQLEEIRNATRERKSERLQLRITPTEKTEVEEVAELFGISVADYLLHLHRRAMGEFERKIEHDQRRVEREGDRDLTDEEREEIRRAGPREQEKDQERRARRHREGPVDPRQGGGRSQHRGFRRPANRRHPDDDDSAGPSVTEPRILI